MNYISTIVKQNKIPVKKKVSKNKPLLILYKSKNVLCDQMYICLPEDEVETLKQSFDSFVKEDFERIVITKKDKGWLANITLSMPRFIL